MLLYLIVLAATELAISLLVAFMTRAPGQIGTTIMASTLLLMALSQLVYLSFNNSWPILLPFILLGLASPVAIFQLFTAKENPD